ncbi:MFS transporter [Streptomyces collinus]|uniref:MFS transporter n=1 Tax=Streptomyces collinus TaxID=42684 RepID=UPI0033B942BF
MSGPSLRLSYAALFRIPHARRTFVAALTGRLSYGIVPLAMMLTTTHATSSLAAAGTVMALFGAASVFLSPVRAALIDRHGARCALIPMSSLYAGLLTAFAVTAWRPGAPALAIGALAVAAGACTPPLGPTMRTVWRRLVPDEALLRRAYSLDGVLEETLFVSGPLVVGAVVHGAPPAAAVVLSALLVWSGTVAFVMSPAVADVCPDTAKVACSGRRRQGARSLARPVVVALGVGLSLGAVDLLVVAFAEQHHYGAATAAWVLAALSLSSALGGLLNGAVDGRLSPGARLSLTVGGLGLALLAAAFAPGLGTLTVAVACAGFFVAPALTTSYLIADAAAPAGFRTQAGAWVNTAVNAGSSGGAAGVGLLLGQLPLGWCFAISGAVSLTAALVTLLKAPAAPTVRLPSVPERETAGEEDAEPSRV